MFLALSADSGMLSCWRKLHANFRKAGRNDFDSEETSDEKTTNVNATRRTIGQEGAVAHPPPGLGVNGDGTSRIVSLSLDLNVAALRPAPRS